MIKRALFWGLSIVLLAGCAGSNLTHNSNATRVNLTIASEMTDCVGVAPQTCFLVKEEAGQVDWHYFYSQIDGFEYEPGFEYQLIIDKVPRENVAADQSSIAYHLVKTVSKIEKKSENLPKTIRAKTTWNQR